MAKSKIILTERLKIAPYSFKYLTAKYIGWLNDPEVVRYSEARFRKHTISSCRGYLQSFNNSPNYLWAVVERIENLGHIGNINSYVDTNNMIADVGIMIGEKSLWGKGYGKEAFIGVIDYLFTIKGMRKVTAGTVSVNTSMLKIMSSCGMQDDGIRKRHYLHEGKEVDVVHMAVFREDWKS